MDVAENSDTERDLPSTSCRPNSNNTFTTTSSSSSSSSSNYDSEREMIVEAIVPATQEWERAPWRRAGAAAEDDSDTSQVLCYSRVK